MGNDAMAITNFVFMTTGVADAIVEGLDEKLSETAFDEYIMSREVITAIRETLDTMTKLTKKLFEENQTIMDAIMKVKESVEKTP